jgi:hypothetical protein
MISKSKNDYMSEGAIAGSCACWSLSIILPVLQEDMKVTTVQRAPPHRHDTESNFAQVWKSPTLRAIENVEE